MHHLIQEVEKARQDFIAAVSGLSSQQYHYKATPDQWAIIDIAEHMVWAEQIGVNGMWKALAGIENGDPIWEGTPEHAGRNIEEVVDLTWQTKEKVPEVAKPRWGGALDFWINALKACRPLLAALSDALADHDPAQIIYPHPISGPLNVVQRIEFLRFHLDRHRAQVERIKADAGFPTE
ncbi:MAG: DinB family protein [Saprospiraceae bacterium]|nr:DinB family protein [Saprospiraceae bacterium]